MNIRCSELSPVKLKIILTLILLLGGKVLLATEETPTPGEELLTSVAGYIQDLDIGLDVVLQGSRGVVTQTRVETILSTNGLIALATPEVFATEAIKDDKGTIIIPAVAAAKEIPALFNFSILGLDKSIRNRTKAIDDLKASILALNKEIENPASFSLKNWLLCNNARTAIRMLEAAKTDLVESLTKLANDVRDTPIAIANDPQAEEKKHVLVQIIYQEVYFVNKYVNEQLSALNPSAKWSHWCRATAYESGNYVYNNQWWFIGSSAVLTAAVLAYCMRNRFPAKISINKLPWLNSFFRRKTTSAPVLGTTTRPSV